MDLQSVALHGQLFAAHMSPQNLDTIRELFLKVRSLAAAERAAILDVECRNDAATRAEVEELLAADVRPGGVKSHVDRPLPPSVDVAIPGYRVIRVLGDGGQGIVYLATQQSTGRRVAVKVLKALAHGSERARARFDREVQVLAALEHPNIVSIIDRGTLADGSPFLAMDFVDGVSLGSWITSRAAKIDDPGECAKGLLLFVAICDALDVAHSQGITHRDLKPENILIDERDAPHIVDFGLAHAFAASGGGAGGKVMRMSLTGQFMGSLPWASPEQANGQLEKIDARSDVYSLGVLLYQLIADGQFPYEVAGTMREVLDNILTAQPPRPSAVLAKKASRELGRRRVKHSSCINRELDAIVLKALAKRRIDRYQTAGQLGRDLKNYLAGRPGSAIADSHKSRARQLVQVAAIVLISAIVAGATASWVWTARVARNESAMPLSNTSPAGEPHGAINNASQPTGVGGAGLTDPATQVAIPSTQTFAAPDISTKAQPNGSLLRAWSIEPLAGAPVGAMSRSVPLDSTQSQGPWMYVGDAMAAAEIFSVSNSSTEIGTNAVNRALRLTYPNSPEVGAQVAAECKYPLRPAHEFESAPYLVLSARIRPHCDRLDTHLRYLAGCTAEAGNSNVLGFRIDCWADPTKDPTQARADLGCYVIFEGVGDTKMATDALKLDWDRWSHVAIAADRRTGQYLWVAASGTAPIDLTGTHMPPLEKGQSAVISDLEAFVRPSRDQAESINPTDVFEVAEMRLTASANPPPIPQTGEGP